MSERVVVSCYRLLGFISFVLKVRSWSCNNVPVYLYQMNVIFCHSCPVKWGQSLKAQLSPWNVPSWITRNRSHLAAPSGQGSHILPSSHPWSSQAPNQIGPVSSGCPSEETILREWGPGRWPLLVGCRDADWGEVHTLQGLGQCYWRALMRALEHYRMSSPVYSLGPPAHPLAQGWLIYRPSKECLNLPLLSLSSWWPPHQSSFITSLILPSWH